MTAHTLGPWVEFSESGDWWINQADKDGSPTAFGYVCSSEGVSPADVRLICAAPDLLNACVMAREELVFGGDWKAAKGVLTRAIAKAIGEEP